MLIGKYLYKVKVYIAVFWYYGLFPWELKNLKPEIEADWNNIPRYRMYGTIFGRRLHIDFKPHHREFWWKFLSRFMLVGDVLYVCLTEEEKSNEERTIEKWKQI